MNDKSAGDEALEPQDGTSPLLDQFGERLRLLRARGGLTRRALAEVAGVSERYLSNLEFGRANPSLLVLQQLAAGLGCTLAELIGDVTASSAEWLLIRDLLEGRSDAEFRKARVAIGAAIGKGGAQSIGRRVALIGLRGAGKSTLGRMLSVDLGLPLVELSAEIEKIAGYSIREIYDLHGQQGYRRYERRALEQLLHIEAGAVITAPGGVVSEPSTFNLLLSHCTTVWLRASAEDHMNRVVRQGDLRPMDGNAEAMDDLRRILVGRTAFYSKADLSIDTSAQPLDETFSQLRALVRNHLKLPM